MNANQALGHYGEKVAVRYLGGIGMWIVERNWRCPEGEIDIVANDPGQRPGSPGTLVICEVKARSARAFQQPTEAIPPPKARRLRLLAERWLHERAPVLLRPAHAEPPPLDIRIDLLAVVLPRRGACTVEHLKGVA
ncbi:YraN family protein [Allostreptomyces psammosilenae]|uniref:UPF0102 protein FHU37_005445 n=1 Tax=Allostreptomyces psammosilenae TaxID=1892865 RepID=A0A853A1H5_9ACTN|nr:YraN family protein [Allostreptomyces psammosilenae]NYI08416.1 putative endonuclease [Allostreptomyces psammosilenae]